MNKDKIVNEKTINNIKDLGVSNPKPSKELLEALGEGEQIIKDIESGKRKGYKNVNEMIKAILQDNQ